MDAVEKLFQTFPDPESAEKLRRQIQNTDSKTYEKRDADQFAGLPQAVADFASADPVDADHEFIKQSIQYALGDGRSFNLLLFRQKILELSLSKTEIPDDGSAKSKQLQYYKWIGQGRKDPGLLCSPTTDASHDSSSLAFLHSQLANSQAYAACGASGGRACTGCRLALDSDHFIFKTVYCSKECQAAHRQQHKAPCDSRRVIGRAAILLRSLFLMFKDLHYSDCIEQVTSRDGVLYTTIGNHRENASKGRQMIRRFPRKLLTPADEDFETVQAMQLDTEVFGTFACILNFFLDPICRWVEEVEIYTRNAHRPIVVLQSGSMTSCMSNPHFALRVTLHSGEDVVVDLTGAKFGWKEPVGPWGIWEAQRVYGGVKAYYRGYLSDWQKKREAEWEATNSWLAEVSKIGRSQIGKMLGAIIYTVKSQHPDLKGSVAGFLRLRSRNYDDASAELVETARQTLAAGLIEILTAKKLRMYWTPDWALQVTVTKEQADHLKPAWLNDADADYEENKHDDSQLKKIWMQRCLDHQLLDSWFTLGLSPGVEVDDEDDVDDADDEDDEDI
ncbi:hypothetical protein PG994_012586 [Apiospora phragmitis]|uniref:MYND-type domain-containing protein n=1 Tax=Apiospora phragmitis TaxID=2905665 RepID=A0ABR1TAX3_9PEZI